MKIDTEMSQRSSTLPQHGRAQNPKNRKTVHKLDNQSSESEEEFEGSDKTASVSADGDENESNPDGPEDGESEEELPEDLGDLQLD